jgi:hypothetical protein
MRSLFATAALSIATLAAGCGGGPGRDLFHGGGLPSTDTSVTPLYRIQPDGTNFPNFANGVDQGYLIGASTNAVAALPASYRVVWLGDGVNTSQRFTGSVWTGGNFRRIARGCEQSVCALEQGDYISTVKSVGGGQRIDWDTYADSDATGSDGLDFVVDADPVYFDFFIDGARRPTNVFFFETTTGALATVDQLPFSLTTQ